MFPKHLIKNLICFVVLSIIVLNLNTLKVYAVPSHSTERADGGGGSSTITSSDTSSDPSENPDYYHPKTLSPE